MTWSSRGVLGSSVRRSLLLIPVVVVLAGGLVACSDKAVGLPQPADTTSSTVSGSDDPFPTGPVTTGVTQPSAAKSPIASVAPCSLLSAAEVADLRAGPGKDEKVREARACTFNEGDGFVMGVAIYDELGIDDVVAHGEIKPVPVGAHKAVQWLGGIDTCAVTLEITKTSRVDLQGTAGGNEQKSCDLALKVAKLVEPRLPK
jgi:hypothetical protein